MGKVAISLGNAHLFVVPQHHEIKEAVITEILTSMFNRGSFGWETILIVSYVFLGKTHFRWFLSSPFLTPVSPTNPDVNTKKLNEEESCWPTRTTVKRPHLGFLFAKQLENLRRVLKYSTKWLLSCFFLPGFTIIPYFPDALELEGAMWHTLTNGKWAEGMCPGKQRQ